jgi:microcystin-dependent protein
MHNSFFSRSAANIAAVLFLLPLLLATTTQLRAQDPFIAEIRMFAGNFAPRGWAFCDGQLLSISQNTALFSLLGTTYGGNGTTTFALPDLRGRVPMHAGQGPGLTDRILGEQGGEETHTLLVGELPAHSHPAYADSAVGTAAGPPGGLPGRNAAGIPAYGSAPSAMLHPGAVGVQGGGQPHNTMQPYLVINFIIALEGIYPSRN